MRFLIIPFMIFVLSFMTLRTSGVWSTKNNWKRIGLETGVALGATAVTIILITLIVTFF